MTLAHENAFDNSFIFIKDQATEDFDRGIDAPKLIGAGERLAIASGGTSNRKAVFNYIGEDKIERTIPLFVKGEQEGSYQITFETIGNVAGLSQAYLVDTYEGTQTPIGTPYHFMIPKGGAIYADRFHLSVKEAGSLNVSEVLINAYPNPVMEELSVEIKSVRSASVVLLDNMGRLVSEIDMTYALGNATGKADTRAMRSGVYILRAVTDRGVATQKIVKQ